MKPAKRKAILDGILFEIFFDSQGEARKRLKINFFNEAFELEQYPEFKDSFDFIAGHWPAKPATCSRSRGRARR